MADQYSIYCPSCHQKTSVSVRAGHNSSQTGKFYEIAECNACDFHVLLVRDRDNRFILNVYPHPLPKSTDHRIPETIKKDFDEALLCLSVGAIRGAAVLARRAVQNICEEKGISKRDLKDQIDELFSKNVITSDLRDWAHEVRYVGNDAAHPNDNDNDVDKNDAEEIIDLLESLCEVLYVAPAKAANRKEIREKGKSNSNT